MCAGSCAAQDVHCLADFVALRWNPLEDVRRLERLSFVMKGGVAIRGPTR